MAHGRRNSGDISGKATRVAAFRVPEANQVERIVEGLRDAGFNDDQPHADQIARRRAAPFWEQFDLPEGLKAKLVERVAPFFLAAGEPRTVHLEGTTSPSYP